MHLSALEMLVLDAARQRDASLAADRGHRLRHGIVHTPPELARFVVRAVDELLRDELGLAQGLADASVDVIDPACGPGAFLAPVIDVWAADGNGRARIIGLDRDEAALIRAEALRPAAEAVSAGFALRHVDTLREVALGASPQGAGRTLVVLGNPPWAVAAAQPSDAMQDLLEDFRRDPRGVRLAERKLGVLSDSYVRFFRWAAELARQSSASAVVAFVTNGSFLDGPVHRGMRAALARWFDAIDVVDLGGSALLARDPNAGARDGNVFDVRTSVAISFCMRRPRHGDRRARVRYTRVWGGKDHKLDMLASARLRELSWSAISSPEEGTRFLPATQSSASHEYASWPSLAEAMPFHREGVQSNRDAAVIDRDRARLLSRLRSFVAGRALPELDRANAPLSHYDPKQARRAVAQALERDPEGVRGESVRMINYRPFDVRYFCPVPPFCHRARGELQRAFDHQGALALISVRKDRGSAPYAHFAASASIVDNCFLSTRSSCRARAFPLYDADGADNLAKAVAVQLTERAGEGAGSAHSWLCYALAVLAAPSYRARFADALRADYPRIPWPDGQERFAALVAIGQELVAAFTEPLSAQPRPDLGVELPPQSTLRIGHHAPLTGYVALQRGAAFTPEAAGQLVALHARLQELAQACARADDAVAPLLLNTPASA